MFRKLTKTLAICDSVQPTHDSDHATISLLWTTINYRDLPEILYECIWRIKDFYPGYEAGL